MDNEQIESLIKQLKATGLKDEEIMDVFFQTFQQGKMDRKDLEVLTEAMGYELTDEFKNDPTPDPIASKGAEGMSKEDLENAKAIEPGQSPEEFKEEIEETKEEMPEEKPEGEEEEKEEPKGEEGKEEPEEEPEESEEEEWEKAQKMFKI